MVATLPWYAGPRAAEINARMQAAEAHMTAAAAGTALTAPAARTAGAWP